MVWGYMLEDADVVLMAMGSVATEATVAVDELREKGCRAGVLGLRVYRPFPVKEAIQAVEWAKVIVVFDKNISYGYQGASCSDLKAALYGSGARAAVHNYIVGLGGRNVKAREMAEAAERSLRLVEAGEAEKGTEWLNCHI